MMVVVVEVEVVMVVVVVVDVVEIDLIDEHVRFGTYNWLNFTHQFSILMDNLFKFWVMPSKVDLIVMMSPSIAPTLAERRCEPSSSPAIIRKLQKL